MIPCCSWSPSILVRSSPPVMQEVEAQEQRGAKQEHAQGHFTSTSALTVDVWGDEMGANVAEDQRPDRQHQKIRS